MTRLILEYPLEDAKQLVREAFYRTHGISSVQEGQRQIVGKTGISFPRVLWSWGEYVYADFSDTGNDGQVQVDIWAEKAVWMNITAKPQTFKRRFLSQLEALRGINAQEIEHRPAVSQKTQGESTFLSGVRLILFVIISVLLMSFVLGGAAMATGWDNDSSIVALIGIAVMVAPGVFAWKKLSDV